MSISPSLLSKFAGLFSEEDSTSQAVTVYGTATVTDGVVYVQIDGSETLTPATTTVEVTTGARVRVSISNHTAVVTGCVSSPAASSDTVSDLADEVSTVSNQAALAAALAEANQGNLEELEKIALTTSNISMSAQTYDNGVIKQTFTVGDVSYTTYTSSDGTYLLTNVGVGDEGDTYFKVDTDGLLTANNAIIYGTIYATDGYFAGELKAATGSFYGSVDMRTVFAERSESLGDGEGTIATYADVVGAKLDDGYFCVYVGTENSVYDTEENRYSITRVFSIFPGDNGAEGATINSDLGCLNFGCNMNLYGSVVSYYSSPSFNAIHSKTGCEVAFGVGSGGYNRGVYDRTTASWIIYNDEAGHTILPGPVVLSNTTDATAEAGTYPALQIGSVSGSHLKLDGNEVMALSAETDTGTLALNAEGGKVTIGSGGLTSSGSIIAGGHSTAIGSVLSATSTSDVSLSADTNKNLQTLSLPAGSWILVGSAQITPTGATRIQLSINNSSATGAALGGQTNYAATAVAYRGTTSRIVTNTATITWYLVANTVSYSGTANSSYLYAMRIA